MLFIGSITGFFLTGTNFNEAKNYQQFKGKLIEILNDVEVKEGQAGFTYE